MLIGGLNLGHVRHLMNLELCFFNRCIYYFQKCKRQLTYPAKHEIICLILNFCNHTMVSKIRNATCIFSQGSNFVLDIYWSVVRESSRWFNLLQFSPHFHASEVYMVRMLKLSLIPTPCFGRWACLPGSRNVEGGAAWTDIVAVFFFFTSWLTAPNNSDYLGRTADV